MNFAKQQRKLGLTPLNSLVGSMNTMYKMPFDTVNEYK